MLSFMSNESNPVRDQYPSMSWENRGLTREGRPSSGLGPKPPPMQVVTKGWWVLREREASRLLPRRPMPEIHLHDTIVRGQFRARA
jgi:hypothetical protein